VAPPDDPGARGDPRLTRSFTVHLHILGICGTFMGGIAAIAQAAGHRVSGCDANVYPPMSTQLEALGIALTEGFDATQLQGVAKDADVFVVGNVVSRGNPLMEAILDAGLSYVSGPQWLYENVLRERFVLAVAGTHGKTTTTAMLAWILDQAGLQPGFLIGGVPAGFGVSARHSPSSFFVIEADEYDTAFFDKRSKFVHYRPRTVPRNSSRRFTPPNVASAARLSRTGTPAWRAAAMAASAFSWLCLPSSAKRSVPCGAPPNWMAPSTPMVQSGPVPGTSATPKRSTSLQHPRARTRARLASPPLTISRPLPGTVRTR